MTATDLVVAGGGPAGLATAIRARMCGLRVVVLDPLKPPVDRACGEGLMPDGLERLEELGIDTRRIESMPFFGVRYFEAGLMVEGRFPDKPGRGIRRTRLHQALVARAEALGVDLRWGIRVTELDDGGFNTTDGPVQAGWLVGADGRTSRVRRWAGLEGRRSQGRRIGLRRHYEVEPWSELVEVYWADGCEAYVTPVGERLVGVAMLGDGVGADFDQMLARFPELQGRIASSPVASRDRGAGPFQQRSRKVVRGNLALVGDASGSLDPISGEGLALSFHQAFAVVDAVLSGDLGRYAAAHRKIVRFPRAITRLLLLIEGRPRLRHRVMRSLSHDPTLMSRFLALRMRPGGRRVIGGGGLISLSVAALWGR